LYFLRTLFSLLFHPPYGGGGKREKRMMHKESKTLKYGRTPLLSLIVNLLTLTFKTQFLYKRLMTKDQHEEKTSVGKLLKSYRLARGMSASDLARLSGLKANTIYGLESTGFQVVGKKRLASICSALGLTPMQTSLVEELWTATPKSEFQLAQEARWAQRKTEQVDARDAKQLRAVADSATIEISAISAKTEELELRLAYLVDRLILVSSRNPIPCECGQGSGPEAADYRCELCLALESLGAPPGTKWLPSDPLAMSRFVFAEIKSPRDPRYPSGGISTASSHAVESPHDELTVPDDDEFGGA
jgi:transcriptional regulator with XRE-family HTH domain